MNHTKLFDLASDIVITPLFIVDLKKNLCRLPGREEGVCEWVCRGPPALHNLSVVAHLGASALALLLLAQMVCEIVQISFSKILKVYMNIRNQQSK